MFRRALSILLCGCLLAGSVPVTGFAAEEQVSETEVTVENAGGGYIEDAPAQPENDADAFDKEENADSVDRESGEKTEITETEEKTNENETVTETKGTEPEDTKTDGNTDLTEEVREPETVTENKVTEPETLSESADLETAEPETQTEVLTDETDVDETAVNSEGEEVTAAAIKNVQEGGYYIIAEIELPSTIPTAYLYWKEPGKDYNRYTNYVRNGDRAVLSPAKPDTEYVLQLRSSMEDDAQVYDEKTITTSADYKFNTSVSFENITTTSADIKVAISDYNGAYTSGSSSNLRAYIYAMTEYTNAQGSVQTRQSSGNISFDSTEKGCTITVRISDLQAGTAYTLPIWIWEYSSNTDGLKKKLDDVTFTTLESTIASKLKFEALADETDKTKINYTVSLDTTSGMDGLEASYSGKVFYNIKGAPASEVQSAGSFYLRSSNEYKQEGSFTNLYAGTEYELKAIVDGAMQTLDVSTGIDGITPVISLSPLSLGGKLNVKLEGTPEASDSYKVNAYVKYNSNSWSPLSYQSKTGSSYGGMGLTSDNNYQGEWLVYSNSYIGSGGVYEIKVEITKNNTVINKKYLTLNTSAISLDLGTENVGGRAATITCQISDPDEFFTWSNYSPSVYACVYYRVKGSESAWEKYNSSISLSKYVSRLELEDLAVNTEYEVKVAFGEDENLIYGTTEFKTTEGADKGIFSDLRVAFSGFDVRVEGTYTPSDYADEVKLYLVETDSTGNKTAETELSYNKTYRSINSSGGLNMETAKVQIKAVETLEGKDEEGNPVKKEYLTEEYTRGNIPNVTFSLSNIGTGVQNFHADLTYTGDMCLGKSYQTIRVELYYGKTGEEMETYPKTTSVSYSKDGSKTQRLTFSGLTENTKYSGRLVVYVSSVGGSSQKVYEQEITLEDFTTKANATYSLETTFPDARLRELVIKAASLDNSATEVTAVQLEKITHLSGNRSNFDTAAVKDLTGIDVLTELTSLDLRYNEVSDMSKVDWSKLVALKYLDLTGNDLTTIPDLSKNTALTRAWLNENMIPEQEFATISAKIPDGVSISNSSSSNMSDVQIAQQSQRIGGLQVVAEETYYQRAGKSPLLVKLSGYKTGLPYTFKYLVDGNEVSLSQKTGDIQYSTDTGLAVGNYALTVEMYKKDEKESDKTLTFNMAEGGAFAEKMPYRYSTQQDSYSLSVYSDKKLSAVYMQKDNDIVAKNSYINSYTSSNEYRYKTLSSNGISLSGLEMYSNSVSLNSLKQKTQAGTYDLRLVYTDGTEEILSDAVEVIGKAYIASGSIGYDYDSTGNFFYLSIRGYGFDASKLDYTFTYKGAQQTASYVNAKEMSDGYIVKFKKVDAWTPKEGDSVQVKVAPKSGYEVVFGDDTFTVYISQGIYYCAYNEVTNKIEIGVTSNLKRENVTFKLDRYNSWEDANQQKNVLETIDVTPETVTETISYLLPMKDGAVYKLPSASYYRLSMTCGDYSDYETFQISGESKNYWSNQKYVIEGTGDKDFWYYSLIPYVKNNQNEFTAELTGDSLKSPLQVKKVWTYDYFGGQLTTVGMTFDLSKLAQGKYTITVSHNNEKLSSYAFEVIPGDKFVVTDEDSLYASWIDDSSFRVGVNTINTGESDNYTVTLTDIFGNKVAGLKTEVANRYSNSVYLKVTGLKKEDAYRYYYIYVTHDTLGEAYKTDRTTKYFSDEKGQYEQIYDNDFTYTETNKRVVGVGMYNGIVFPVTMKIYKPYDTEPIASVEINQSDLKSGTSNPAYYYFKQTLIDALPDKDALYDIVLIDSERKTSIRSEEVLGTQESATASNWTVAPTQLALNLDSEAAKTGTITVTGATGTPAFKSDNTKVATVAADKTDKNKAVVTAVAEGTTTISVTADKVTKTVAVTVTKEPVKPTGITVSAPETTSIGKVEISASVQPAGAWTQQNSITWTSSDTSVISIPAGSTGLVVEADALKAGKATVTAKLDGTEFTASCEIEVIKEVSDDEQDEIAKEIGTLYFLEGADSTLADIKLPDGWSWENPTEQLTADNSHPVQDFAASYNKDDASFERYLDVRVSKLESIRIVGKDTVNSGKNALYTCAYTYIGADPRSGYETSWKWTLGSNLAAETDTGRNINVKVSGSDTLSAEMTVKNTVTGKTVSAVGQFAITAGEVPDSEPELENKKITVYKNSTQPVPIGLVAKDGNSITAVNPGSTDFRTEQDENGEWLIGLTDSGKGKYTKKTAETLTLTVKTESGNECERTLGVTVDVTEITAKNVKFKQTLKPNAAYSDTDTVRAEFTVSSKYFIEDITAAKEGGAFTVKSYSPASGTLVLEAKTDALNKDAKSYAAKADVKVRDYGTQTLDISVAVQNRKPSLKLGEAVILSGVNADASVALYNGKTELSCADYTVTKTEGEGVTLTKEGSAVKLSYTGTKKGTYKAKVRKSTWAKDVELELKGNVSILDPAKAKLGADLSKATINITQGYSGPVTVNVGIKGSSVSVDLTAEPAKDKDKQAITAEVTGGKIRITPKDGAKKGSYKIAVGGSIGGVSVKGLTISVNLTDKAPEVKLSAKGKINLANREGTSIIYTPKLANLPETLSIKSVRTDKTAKDSGFFNVKLTSEGKVVMTAVTGKTMNPKTKYNPVLIFTLSNGKTLKTGEKFKVSVTNSLPKVTVTTLSSALCTSNTEHRASYKLDAGNGYTISNVTTDDANCKVSFNSSTNTVYVSLSDGASVTVGKKYTVPCKVYIKGADNTTKPLTVKLKAVIY